MGKLNFETKAPSAAVAMLRENFHQSNQSLSHYAKRVGIERSALARILRGDREPTLQSALRLAAFADFHPGLFAVPEEDQDLDRHQWTFAGLIEDQAEVSGDVPREWTFSLPPHTEPLNPPLRPQPYAELLS